MTTDLSTEAKSSITKPKQELQTLCRTSEFVATVEALSRKHFESGEVEAVLMSAIATNPKILQCTKASIFQCVLQCVRWRLLPDGVAGMCHLIPYGEICKLVPGYHGLRELALRSPHVASISPPRTVWDRDHEMPYEFLVRYGTDERIVHNPCLEADRGDMTHVYCVATMSSGDKLFVVLTMEQCNKVKARVLKGKRKPEESPWNAHFEAMCQKTAILRLCKALPKSQELSQAVSIALQEEAGLSQTLSPSPIVDAIRTDNQTGKRTLGTIVDAAEPLPGSANGPDKWEGHQDADGTQN